MRIIEATTEQLDDAVNMFEQYMAFYKLDEDHEGAHKFIHDRLIEKDADIFLAYDEDTCVGFMQLYRCWDSLSMKKLLFLYDLFVTPEHRNQKIGDQFIERSKQLAKEIDAAMIMLQTHKRNNTYARRFYENNGFELDEDFDVYNFEVN